jgi:hypothetical protein
MEKKVTNRHDPSHVFLSSFTGCRDIPASNPLWHQTLVDGDIYGGLAVRPDASMPSETARENRRTTQAQLMPKWNTEHSVSNEVLSKSCGPESSNRLTID